ncbi:beta-ketoacyl synthase [SAR86 cluster bacterium]|nr:beta-ketoacyl synthase [SAR86 cluster bacterium]
MSNNIPVIVSYGGINAAGRSTFDFAHKRMTYESQSQENKNETISSLSQLTTEISEEFNLKNSLIREIDSKFFEQHCLRSPELPSKAGGQLPTNFDPAKTYKSRQHPRSLAMSIFAASDALKGIGIDWQSIVQKVSPEKISCVSGCAISTGDKFGMGGLFQANLVGSRTSSKHLAFSLGEMSADFVHAYVLGSMGATGNYMGACATFQYNLKIGIEQIKSGDSKVCFVGASESGLIPEVYEGFSATTGLAEEKNSLNLQRKLQESSDYVNYKKICRPFGENVGMSLGESAQFIVLMDENLAIELGCNIYGATLSSHVNADGFKKSISGPGIGNYITVGKTLNEISNSFGEEGLNSMFVHAHGTGTPQNRVTESHILSELCNVFNINNLPVTGIKSYLGHSLAAAGGDQVISSIGTFNDKYIPGIKTIPEVADNVYKKNLNFLLEDVELDRDIDFVLANAKGFGGNNGTALIASKKKIEEILKNKYGEKKMQAYRKKNEDIKSNLEDFKSEVVSSPPTSMYNFGNGVVDGESDIRFTKNKLHISKINAEISIESALNYKLEDK